MALSPGDRLGPYAVLAQIGAGGMGEVYKARDTRLDRTVAIKVLPEHIGAREDLRARFEREARAVASLNHPNICTLYDIGNQDGVGGFMVMELIEGESLAERIEKGAIPLDQALKIAAQIADALDRAHRVGVTHRDIKPQNIMLTRDGAKVLDFGLAKSVASTSGPAEATLTKVLTTEGTVMGTPQYMAPELFEGREADARSDIWAYGAVLYEMVTGQKAFQGASYSSLVGAILATDPPSMSLQSLTPAWLERLVRRCLQKEPENRYHCIRDLLIDLKSPPAEVVPAAVKSSRLPWAVAGASTLALLVAGVLLFSATRPALPRPLMHLKIEVPTETPLARVDLSLNMGGNILALSPDGTRLLLSLRGADGKTRLHTRLLHQRQITPLTGTENAYSPFFSPAGDWIGFFAERKLKKISVDGGAAVTLCDAPIGFGGSWGDDGNIVAALDARTVLSRVPSSGGTPVPVTKLNPEDTAHRWPQVLPGSQAVLFTAVPLAANDEATIEVLSLKSGERKPLHRGGFFPRYLAGAAGSAGSGHIVYLRKSTLFAVPFHLNRLAVTGPPVPVLEDVGSTGIAGGDFTFAASGTFVYLEGKARLSAYPISLVDGRGTAAQPLHAPLGQYLTPRFSPDGKRLAFSAIAGDGADIWVKDLDRDIVTRLSFVPGWNSHPVWTPDGKTIVFLSENPAAPGLYGVRSDSSGEAKLLAAGRLAPTSFSPDGKRLTMTEFVNGSGWDIATLPAEPDATPGSAGVRLGKAELFLRTPFSESGARFSPDGRWLAYTSNMSGIFEVYVRPFRMPAGGTGGLWQVSAGGARWPIWSADGRELFFMASDGRVMAAGYTVNGDTFTAAKPKVWAETRLNNHRLKAVGLSCD